MGNVCHTARTVPGAEGTRQEHLLSCAEVVINANILVNIVTNGYTVVLSGPTLCGASWTNCGWAISKLSWLCKAFQHVSFLFHPQGKCLLLTQSPKQSSGAIVFSPSFHLWDNASVGVLIFTQAFR